MELSGKGAMKSFLARGAFFLGQVTKSQVINSTFLTVN